MEVVIVLQITYCIKCIFPFSLLLFLCTDCIFTRAVMDVMDAKVKKSLQVICIQLRLLLKIWLKGTTYSAWLLFACSCSSFINFLEHNTRQFQQLELELESILRMFQLALLGVGWSVHPSPSVPLLMLTFSTFNSEVKVRIKLGTSSSSQGNQ